MECVLCKLQYVGKSEAPFIYALKITDLKYLIEMQSLHVVISPKHRFKNMQNLQWLKA